MTLPRIKLTNLFVSSLFCLDFLRKNGYLIRSTLSILQKKNLKKNNSPMRNKLDLRSPKKILRPFCFFFASYNKMFHWKPRTGEQVKYKYIKYSILIFSIELNIIFFVFHSLSLGENRSFSCFYCIIRTHLPLSDVGSWI